MTSLAEPVATASCRFCQAYSKALLPVRSGARLYTCIDGVTYKIADCRQEREAAFRLVHDAYVHQGLMEPNSRGLRVTPFHLLPGTEVFIAVHQGRVVYTAALIRDGLAGLPMDVIYQPEVDKLRAQGLDLAEVSCLAAERDCFSRKRMYLVFVHLTSLIVHASRRRQLDRMLITVHPRHVRFYERLVGFQPFGDERSYASVRYHPAVACQHDFERNDRFGYPLYGAHYEERFQPWELKEQRISQEEISYFRRAAELCQCYIPAAA